MFEASGKDLTPYLDPKLVTFLETGTRDECIRALVDRLDKEGFLRDKDEFLRAVFEREKIVSTGIGMGIAIPHAKLANYDSFFIAVGILKRGIDWHAIDGVPVRLIFMIGGPDDRQTQYLQILSSLTMAIKDENRLRRMLSLEDPEDLLRIFHQSGSEDEGE